MLRVRDRLVIEVPNRSRESNSSCGSAGVLAKVISGRVAVPRMRIVAASDWMFALA